MRNKTPLRQLIDSFLADRGEYADDWLSIPYTTNQEKRIIYSMAYNLRQRGAAIDIVEYDLFRPVVWIKRCDV